ncbi:cytochrome P450 [Nemania diffusa]|nr:cytochrome P450 [Nemania diffusa]
MADAPEMVFGFNYSIQNPLSTSTIALLIFFVLYLVASGLYGITFHPLATVPGPKLCGISRIPYWVACLKGQDVFWLHELHRQYGPVLRFGPQDLSYAANEWKPIYGLGKNKRENEKAQEFFIAPINEVPSMLSADYESHSRVRRLLAPAFSKKSLKKQQVLIKKYADLLISTLAERSEDKALVEMTSLFNFTTFDIMAEFCFGYSLGQLETNDYIPWVRAIFEQLRTLPFMSIILYYPVLTTTLKNLKPKWITQKRIEHCQFAIDIVNRRLQEGSPSGDDLWALAGRGLSLQEMYSNAEFFMLAGSETSATLLSGAVFYLLKNPITLKRLAAEVRGHFRSTENMTFENLAKLPYLNASIKEVMRIFPVVAVGSPRVVPEGGQNISGMWLPEGTRISVHHYSVYHSELNFKHPEKFAPERWLGDSVYAKDNRDAHQPFSYGPRDCLGQAFARHEIRLILATLICAFDLELGEESKDWDETLRCYALWEKRKIYCHLTKLEE